MATGAALVVDQPASRPAGQPTSRPVDPSAWPTQRDAARRSARRAVECSSAKSCVNARARGSTGRVLADPQQQHEAFSRRTRPSPGAACRSPRRLLATAALLARSRDSGAWRAGATAALRLSDAASSSPVVRAIRARGRMLSAVADGRRHLAEGGAGGVRKRKQVPRSPRWQTACSTAGWGLDADRLEAGGQPGVWRVRGRLEVALSAHTLRRGRATAEAGRRCADGRRLTASSGHGRRVRPDGRRQVTAIQITAGPAD